MNRHFDFRNNCILLKLQMSNRNVDSCFLYRGIYYYYFIHLIFIYLLVKIYGIKNLQNQGSN